MGNTQLNTWGMTTASTHLQTLTQSGNGPQCSALQGCSLGLLTIAPTGKQKPHMNFNTLRRADIYLQGAFITPLFYLYCS